MPKYAQNLTLKEIKSISKPGMYSIGYVPGLCVRVTTIKISYYFRYQIQRIPKAVIIGDIKYITLNQAKATAHNYRALILMGKDPALEKKAQKEQLHKELQNNQQKRKLIHSSSFAIVAKKYVDYKKDSGAFQYNKRAESDYNSMLRTHVYPIIQNKPIATVTIYEIRDILAKVWDKTSLPKKLTGLLKQIFDWAKAMKYIPANQPNPADMDGPLKVLMEPFRRNRKEEEHLPALDYKEIPEFISEVWKIKTIGAKALLLSILTAGRSQAIRHLTWSQIDFKLKKFTITIASDKVKVKNSQRTIFLSPQSIFLLRSLPKTNILVFPSESLTPISDATLGKVIKDLNSKRKREGKAPFVDHNSLDEHGKPRRITQHGTARSTFTMWAQSQNYNDKKYEDATELCLLHKIKRNNKGAYNRVNVDNVKPLEPIMRNIMFEWGKYCCSLIPELQLQEPFFSKSSN